MEICNPNICTGCAACANACAAHCISMQNNEMGELHPTIDEDCCINCGKCKTVCPNNNAPLYKYPDVCYASWITAKDKRKICASGGIGTVLTEYMLESGGSVYGSRYDKNLRPVIAQVRGIGDVERFKGSRYVHSSISEVLLIEIKRKLDASENVLFIGTPCQVAGLLSFLRKPYPHLITVDLICHGVSPTSYFTEEISYLKAKYKLEDIADARFRGNDGNNYCLSLWNKERQKLFPRNNYCQKILRLSHVQQYYITGFLLGVSLRENCYKCPYARPERISDITIGDFIGLGKTVPFNYSTANVSSVLVNTSKGKAFYNAVSEAHPELVNVERDYKERLQYAPSLVHPFKRHHLNARFVVEYKKSGYAIAIRRVLHTYMWISYFRRYTSFFKRVIHHVFFPNK